MEKVAGITGVVLAGGASRRMGKDKAWLSLRGSPLVSHQAMLLSSAFDDVRVSAKEPDRAAALGLRVVPDLEKAFAPIYGLRSVLNAVPGPVFVLAVDMPRIPPTLVHAIAKRFVETSSDCLVPRAGGKLQTLCAAYRPSILPALERHLGEKRLSLHELVADCSAEIWDEQAWSPYAREEDFRGLNTPEEYETVAIR
jgi:molybdopterin-guanine dinucleotide biosynthesis protein A